MLELTKRVPIGKERACELLGNIHRSTLDRWKDPDSEYFRPDFPPARTWPGSQVCYWYEDEIIKYREDNLVPR
jgi:hypothetical protein